MAEELVDKVIAFKGDKLKHARPCTTKEIKLLGGEGYHNLLHVQLVQKYGVSTEVAKHLVHAYGTAAFAVCELAKPTARTTSKLGVPTDGSGHVGRQIAVNYPYIEAEVIYACKHEMARTVKDMLTTRMRLAFLNSEAAKQAIPRVADLMAVELQWSKKERDAKVKEAYDYIGQFGGPIADKTGSTLSAATFTDLHETFLKIDIDGSGYIDEEELNKAATMLGFPFRNKEHLKAKFKEIDADGNGKITETEFIEWWNTRSTKGTRKLAQMISLTAESEVALEKSLWPEAKK
jgi:glycerol-3-phosphate dehydrogenase